MLLRCLRFFFLENGSEYINSERQSIRTTCFQVTNDTGKESRCTRFC